MHALRPCPATPNCVGSTQTGARAMPPIPYVGDRSATETALRDVLAREAGARLVEARGDYWRAEFTTRLLRFIDDVEFLFDDRARVVHFRSASRVGRSDFGLNARRMQRITLAVARR